MNLLFPIFRRTKVRVFQDSRDLGVLALQSAERRRNMLSRNARRR